MSVNRLLNLTLCLLIIAILQSCGKPDKKTISQNDRNAEEAAVNIKPNRVLVIIGDQWTDPLSYSIDPFRVKGDDFLDVVTMLKIWGIPFDILRLDEQRLQINRFLDYAARPAYGCVIWMADPGKLSGMSANYETLQRAVNEYGISMIALFDYIKTDPVATLAGIRYSDVKNVKLGGDGEKLEITGNHFITAGATGVMLPDTKQLAGSSIPEANGITVNRNDEVRDISDIGMVNCSVSGDAMSSGKSEIFRRWLSGILMMTQKPSVPKWIERGVTHDERLSSERADMFPLMILCNHGRWRTHAQGDDFSWTRETPTGKVLGPDNYSYEPVWINPMDADARDIKDGDMVKVFNERGIVLCGARVWERLRPTVVYVDHGARHDPIIAGRSTAAAPSTLSPSRPHFQAVPAARPPAATWSTSRKSGRRSGRRGAGTIPTRSSESTTPEPVCASTHGSSREATDESVRHRRQPLQRLLRLPVRLQGRARRQRLGPHREATARLRPVLDAPGRAHLRDRAQGPHALHPQPLQPLRQRGVHRVAESKAPSTSATTAWSSSTRTSARAASRVWTPVPTARSTSTTTSTWRRSAPAAPTCWTTTSGSTRAASTHARPRPSSSPRRVKSRRPDRQGRGPQARGRHQAAGVLPQHPEELHRRHAVRPGGEGGRDRRDRHRHGGRRHGVHGSDGRVRRLLGRGPRWRPVRGECRRRRLQAAVVRRRRRDRREPGRRRPREVTDGERRYSGGPVG